MLCSRRAPNLKDILYKRKHFSLSVPGEGLGTHPCGSNRCASCGLTTSSDTFTSTSDGRTYSVRCRATCTSRCVVYLATCIYCHIQYVGNTTQMLRDRITGHRNSKASALYCHLAQHGSEFNKCFKFTVISHTSPNNLLDEETAWINKLRTGEPEGLNRVDPCALRTGIPI